MGWEMDIRDPPWAQATFPPPQRFCVSSVPCPSAEVAKRDSSVDARYDARTPAKGKPVVYLCPQKGRTFLKDAHSLLFSCLLRNPHTPRAAGERPTAGGYWPTVVG